MKIVLFILLLCFQLMASAATRVVFLNGIDGSPEKSLASQKKIVDIVKAAGFGDKFDIDNNIDYIFNTGDRGGCIGNPDNGDLCLGTNDKDELLWQAKLSALALNSAKMNNPASTAGSSEYISTLGQIYFEGIRDKLNPPNNWYADDDEAQVYSTTQMVAGQINDLIAAGHKVIIVAHSQGNFYAESANAYLRYGKTAIELKKYDDNLRFVGAASVAASTPNGRYLTSKEDIAIQAHIIATGLVIPFTVLDWNVRLCFILTPIGLCNSLLIAETFDPSIHGFLEFYTSSFIDKISGKTLADILVGFINVSFDELVAPSTSKLTDTGITASQCYGAGSNALINCTDPVAIVLNSQQDGMTGRDVTTPNAADGKLGFSYSSVGSYPITDCVKDNVTGLIWEGKPTTGYRANTLSYDNYINTSNYVAAVNDIGLCNFNDWRLPTVDELQSLVDYSVSSPGPTIDINWFPNTLSMAYWTSSPFVGSGGGSAWFVSFVDGGISISYISNVNYVRLVR